MSPKKPDPQHPPQPEPSRRPTLSDVLRRQPAWIQSELGELRKHEPRILEALAGEKERALFLRDPGALLAGLGMKVSGPLRQRLRGDVSRAELLRPIAFRLPGGQILRPRVNIRFVKARD